MLPLLRFLLRRALAMPLSLVATTAAIYAIAMLAPAEQRAALYLPSNLPAHLSQERIQHLTELAIEANGLNDPFSVQYSRWAARLARGEWGWSPILRQDVLAALLTPIPATAELALFATIVFLPLGLISSALAGAHRGRPLDAAFRLAAYASTAVPPFILGLFLLALFYVAWPVFPPGRLSLHNDLFVRSGSFPMLTGFLTIDSLLNGRPDVTLDANRHALGRRRVPAST